MDPTTSLENQIVKERKNNYYYLLILHLSVTSVIIMEYEENKKKEDLLEKVTAHFDALGLDDWKAQGNAKSGGQAIGIAVRNIATKELGFFRLLNAPSEDEIRRFKREIKILTDERYYHKNVIKILTHSTSGDNYWYISKQGQPFDTWWHKRKEKLDYDPNRIFDEAKEIVYNLADGLVKLHKEGVVHRDIKVPNIVVIDDEPVLIDFGVSFDPEDERLTEVGEAVGNEMHSPDVARNWLEKVLTWIDIFHLSQLFMWMVAEKNVKHYWRRPLHWRYVNYSKGLSKNNENIIRAVTAIAGTPETSPKDAGQFLDILIQVTSNYENYNMDEASKRILQEMEDSSVSKTKARAENIEMLGADFELIKIFEEKINTSIIKAVNSLAPSLMEKIHIPTNIRLSEYADKIFSNLEYKFENTRPRFGSYMFPCLTIQFGNDPAFWLRTFICMEIPSYRKRYDNPISDEYLNFYLWFEFEGSDSDYFGRNGLTRPHYVCFKPTGEIQVLYNEQFFIHARKANTIDGFIEYAIEQFQNPKCWRLFGKRL
ncbi:protein kinase domain-containing protein [Runella limosa]|uniref:protein kinase domain-containing protein n=1 Tax=Runella limosa TaxID=370978 RepID=UPI0012F9AF61|nr:protein kinase [Runella limosa]